LVPEDVTVPGVTVPGVTVAGVLVPMPPTLPVAEPLELPVMLDSVLGPPVPALDPPGLRRPWKNVSSMSLPVNQPSPKPMSRPNLNLTVRTSCVRAVRRRSDPTVIPDVVDRQTATHAGPSVGR
jgi:hypothetical protein